MSRSRLLGLVLATAAATGAACGSSASGVEAIDGATYRFDLSGGGGFYDHPYPSELEREADGTLDLSDFPVPDGVLLPGVMRRYVELADRGPTPALDAGFFLVFDRPLDPGSLPATPEASLAQGASVQLVDVDPASPERGARIPLTMKLTAGEQRYAPANTLVVLPFVGFTLRASTLHALVVTREARDEGGEPLGSPLALEQLKRGRTPDGALGVAARDLVGPALDELERAGVDRDRVAALTVFRTGDPTADLRAIDRWYRTTRPDPVPEAAPVLTDVFDDYCVWSWTVATPVLQTGSSPYASSGGDIPLDAAGEPSVQRTESVRFSAAVPRGPMPAAGWPMLLYHHGGAGTHRELVERGTEPAPRPGSGPAELLARRGIASMGKDGATGTDRGDPTNLFYFNVLNPQAFVGNVLQNAMEDVLAIRLASALSLPPDACPDLDASASADGRVRFDDDHFLFMGHSTGATVGPPFVAIEPKIEGALMSGSGISYIRQVQWKTEPFPMELPARLLIGLEEELDDFHPFLQLFQTAWERAEPLAYEPHLVRRPFAGGPREALLYTFGIIDHYNPPPAENPAVVSVGLDVAGPLFDDGVTEHLALSGGTVLEAPVAANRTGPGGEPVTAVAVQYPEDGVIDGHHVVFQRPEAKHQVACFFQTLVEEGRARLVPGVPDPDAPCDP